MDDITMNLEALVIVIGLALACYLLFRFPIEDGDEF